jgi:hypothetical protein
MSFAQTNGHLGGVCALPLPSGVGGQVRAAGCVTSLPVVRGARRRLRGGRRSRWLPASSGRRPLARLSLPVRLLPLPALHGRRRGLRGSWRCSFFLPWRWRRLFRRLPLPFPRGWSVCRLWLSSVFFFAPWSCALGVFHVSKLRFFIGIFFFLFLFFVSFFMFFLRILFLFGRGAASCLLLILFLCVFVICVLRFRLSAFPVPVGPVQRFWRLRPRSFRRWRFRPGLGSCWWGVLQG